jgi:hypothetical protein
MPPKRRAILTLRHARRVFNNTIISSHNSSNNINDENFVEVSETNNSNQVVEDVIINLYLILYYYIQILFI